VPSPQIARFAATGYPPKFTVKADAVNPASHASIWPRDHFCCSTVAPRRSRPTTWNEFLPISMLIVATIAIHLLDVAALRFPASLAGWAGARPDQSISGNFGAVTGSQGQDHQRRPEGARRLTMRRPSRACRKADERPSAQERHRRGRRWIPV
jgi:hypothetical protein